jgi:pyrimidine deaminase RibD-like protein
MHLRYRSVEPGWPWLNRSMGWATRTGYRRDTPQDRSDVDHMYEPLEIRQWMRMAVDLGKLSISEGDPTKPYVGAVVVQDGEVVGSGYRGMTAPGHHAEFGVLQGIAPEMLAGAGVFSTLEPCSTRNHPKIPCAQRLVDAKVSEVYIGIYDPNPTIYRQGWNILNKAGISLHDFSADLRDEIAVDNTCFLSRFKTATGDAGEDVRFDFRLNGGKYKLQSSVGDFVVQVGQRGWGSVYVIDHGHHVALARFATEFAQIDDPGALDFANYYASVSIGQIACIRTPTGYLLIQITAVDDRGGRSEVEFRYEVRGHLDGAPPVSQ